MLKFDEETTKLLEIAYQGGDVTRRRRKAFDALHLAEVDMDLSRICAAPSARLSHFPFEGDRAFPTEC